jgi:hypothetical protein
MSGEQKSGCERRKRPPRARRGVQISSLPRDRQHLRLTNGLLEGINTRLRMVARRAFRFHSSAPLIAMMLLLCGGIDREPTLP